MTDQTETDTATLSLDALHAVVELQRTELSRLLREQSRLNERIDSLLRLHEREQVLRQQMQASLDRLVAGGLAAPDRAALTHDGRSADGAATDVAALQARLERTETRFSALQAAVGSLVDHIERHMPGASDDAGFVRVYAPG